MAEDHHSNGVPSPSSANQSASLPSHSNHVTTNSQSSSSTLAEMVAGLPAATQQLVQIIRYLHRLMASEYRENYAQNVRFRPVVFGATGLPCVPFFLRNTIVHEWPRQHSELCAMLYGGLDKVS